MLKRLVTATVLDLKQTQVLFRCEADPGAGRVARSDDCLYKKLADLFCGVFIHYPVDADNATKRGNRISSQRLGVGLEHRRPGRHAARVGVLDDGNHGQICVCIVRAGLVVGRGWS